MNNFDEVTKENKQEVNPQRLQIPDHPCSILIVDGSGSEKTNALFNLTNHQLDIDKIFLYAKGPYKSKYQHLIKKREKVGLKQGPKGSDLVVHCPYKLNFQVS